ncbi:hypothetical protein PDIDSM_3013 [Penicillium digitatum]|nr:hypothetical protein PDIDSM_3013 [Penicillium digitatum]
MSQQGSHPGFYEFLRRPLIDRQEIGDDLEADIKHACAMLSHTIDRGIPAGLSYRSEVPVSTAGQYPVGQTSVEAAPSSLRQNVTLLSAPNPISLQAESTKRHDSGVGMTFNSPSQPGRTYGNSVSRTNSSARFYNAQPYASPPHSPSTGSRPRSHSLVTTNEKDNQRERSFSPSPVPFPYSPPHLNSEWPSNPTTLDSPVSSLNESDTNPYLNKPDAFSPAISPQDAPSLGSTDRTWIHVSRDTQRLTDEAKPPAIQAAKPNSVARFYSSYQTTGEFNSHAWPTKNYRGDRISSIYSDVSLSSSLGGRATTSRPDTGNSRLGASKEHLPGPLFAGSNCGVSYSASCLANESKHKECVYSVAMPTSPPQNNRRKKASLLLKKLTGLGMRRNHDNGVC